MNPNNPSVNHCDPDILNGVPVFAGSQPAAASLAGVDAGNSWARVVESWPWCVFQPIVDGRFRRSWTAFQTNVDAISG